MTHKFDSFVYRSGWLDISNDQIQPAGSRGSKPTPVAYGYLESANSMSPVPDATDSHKTPICQILRGNHDIVDVCKFRCRYIRECEVTALVIIF